MKKDLRIVFMGTPEFAVAILDTLIQVNFQIVAVITAPDKPAGRGKKLQMSAVKQYALEKEIPVLTPTNLKNPEFIEELKSFKPDLQVVVAFRMLPEVLWKLPPLGTFNLHASLLPQYRGAAPINHAIINGEKETGVTTFFLDEQIDTGKIIFQKKCEIGSSETAGELHDRLMKIGADLVVKTVEAISANNIDTIPQNNFAQDIALKTAPKIFKEDGHIQWDQKAEIIFNKIRGLSPYPAAWTYISDHRNSDLIMKIYSSVISDLESYLEPGNVTSDGKTFLRIHTSDRCIDIIELQLQGKKRMLVQDFLRGFQIDENTNLS